MAPPTPRRPLTSPAARIEGLGETIFAEMSALAVETGSVNLGQGFPDSDGPPALLEAAQRAIAAGHNQYPPGLGVPDALYFDGRVSRLWAPAIGRADIGLPIGPIIGTVVDAEPAGG